MWGRPELGSWNYVYYVSVSDNGSTFENLVETAARNSAPAASFIYLLIVFQNPYTGVRPMDIGTVKE